MSVGTERVLRPSRLKLLGLLALCVPALVGGVWLIERGESWGWFLAVLSGLGAFVFSVMLLPNTLVLRLDAEEFRICTLFRSQRFRWADVDQFGVGVIGVNTLVMFNFSAEFKENAIARQAAVAVSGWEGALPDTFGMSAPALADLLNEYKKAAWLSGGVSTTPARPEGAGDAPSSVTPSPGGPPAD